MKNLFAPSVWAIFAQKSTFVDFFVILDLIKRRKGAEGRKQMMIRRQMSGDGRQITHPQPLPCQGGEMRDSLP
jgi:hypothetical protein